MQTSILFVDDEELILTTLGRTLRSSPHRLLFAGCAAEALALLECDRIDVLVTDYMMPVMSGVDLLARVSQRHPDVIRVLMTAQADRKATIRAINEGKIAAFIEKPWRDAALKEFLAQASLDAAQRRPARASPNPTAALRAFHTHTDVLNR
jgi:two-component system, repressor protein LuxO